MNELQLRLELKGAVQGYAEQLLFQNGIPAHLVEDAFSSTLGYLREKTMEEFLNSAMLNNSSDEEKEETENGDEATD